MCGTGSRLCLYLEKVIQKQFLSIKKDDKLSLLQRTIQRISTLKKSYKANIGMQ